MTATYRADIDGLRGVAVASVVCYHLGLSWLPGGFTGVDVFFVISGYLITGILVREVASGSFSIVRFYERRIRRLLPALLVVLIATLIAGWFLFIPQHYEATGGAAAASLLFAANIWFWRTQNYFSPSGDLNPLLHLWSLGVEEQFYLFFPFLIVLGVRYAPRWLPWMLGFSASASFLLCVWATQSQWAQAAFYLLPTRAWELLAGALLVFVPTAFLTRSRHQSVAAYVGLALLLAGFFVIKDGAGFPGWVAAIPVVGTCLLILGARNPDTFVFSILSARPMVALGLVSYSLYLWHWPIIVFARNLFLNVELSFGQAVLAGAVSVALAVLTYRYVERPFRNREQLPLKPLFLTVVPALGLCLAAAVAVQQSGGMAERVSPLARTVAEGMDRYPKQARACIRSRNVDVETPSDACRLGSEGSATFVLWGDSFAGSILPAVDALAGRSGRAGVAILRNACPPTVDAAFSIRTNAANSGCTDHNASALANILRTDSVDTVVVFGAWNRYLGSDRKVLSDTLGRALRALLNAGKSVTLVDGLHIGVRPVPWWVARSQMMGRPLPTRSLPALTDFNGQVPEGVRRIDLREAFCDQRHCAIAAGTTPFFNDANHLSADGSLHVAERIPNLLAPSP